MLSPRAIISPLRAAFRPQTVRIINRAAFIRNNATISEAITADHRELEKYYNEIINNPDDIDYQTRYGNRFTWELARHSVAEELLVYPAMEKYMGEKGKQHAESDRKQHHQVKLLLKDFQNLSPASSTYLPALKHLWALLSTHIAEEERDDLPLLERALSSSENRGDSESLAKNFGRTKALVPSRSHASAGENAYFEGPIDMLTTPINHISSSTLPKFPSIPVISSNNPPPPQPHLYMYNRDMSILHYSTTNLQDFTHAGIHPSTLKKHLTKGTYYLGKYKFSNEFVPLATYTKEKGSLVQLQLMLKKDREGKSKRKR